MSSREKLRGGRADGKPDRDFDANDLRQGTMHEREHTRDTSEAKEIAKDHLAEDPEYYRKLEQMEKSGMDGWSPRGQVAIDTATDDHVMSFLNQGGALGMSHFEVGRQWSHRLQKARSIGQEAPAESSEMLGGKSVPASDYHAAHAEYHGRMAISYDPDSKLRGYHEHAERAHLTAAAAHKDTRPDRVGARFEADAASKQAKQASVQADWMGRKRPEPQRFTIEHPDDAKPSAPKPQAQQAPSSTGAPAAAAAPAAAPRKTRITQAFGSIAPSAPVAKPKAAVASQPAKPSSDDDIPIHVVEPKPSGAPAPINKVQYHMAMANQHKMRATQSASSADQQNHMAAHQAHMNAVQGHSLASRNPSYQQHADTMTSEAHQATQKTVAPKPAPAPSAPKPAPVG